MLGSAEGQTAGPVWGGLSNQLTDKDRGTIPPESKLQEAAPITQWSCPEAFNTCTCQCKRAAQTLISGAPAAPEIVPSRNIFTTLTKEGAGASGRRARWTRLQSARAGRTCHGLWRPHAGQGSTWQHACSRFWTGKPDNHIVPAKGCRSRVTKILLCPLADRSGSKHQPWLGRRPYMHGQDCMPYHWLQSGAVRASGRLAADLPPGRPPHPTRNGTRPKHRTTAHISKRQCLRRGS